MSGRPSTRRPVHRRGSFPRSSATYGLWKMSHSGSAIERRRQQIRQDGIRDAENGRGDGVGPRQTWAGQPRRDRNGETTGDGNYWKHYGHMRDGGVNKRAGKSVEGQELAPQVGLEPTTLRLTAECSTIELLRSKADGTILITAEQAAGCQPSDSATRSKSRAEVMVGTRVFGFEGRRGES